MKQDVVLRESERKRLSDCSENKEMLFMTLKLQQQQKNSQVTSHCTMPSFLTVTELQDPKACASPGQGVGILPGK